MKYLKRFQNYKQDSESTPNTVVPTDSAFEKLPAGTLDALAQYVEDCLVELGDIDYSVQVKKERDNFKGACLKIIISKPGSHFKMSDIKEYTDLVLEYLNECYTYELISKVREYDIPLGLHTNIQYNSTGSLYLSTLIDLFELEIRGIRQF